jgi:hypothetical protein
MNVHDFLEMAPEHGGLRFGPLPDEVVIGSDPARADLIVAPQAGVAAVALTLQRAREGTFTVRIDGAVHATCSIRPPHQAEGDGRTVRDGARFQAGDTLVLHGRRERIALTLRHAALGALAAPLDEPAARGIGPPSTDHPHPTHRPPPHAPPPVRDAPGAPARTVDAVMAEASRQVGARTIAEVPIVREAQGWRLAMGQGTPLSPTTLVSLAVGLAVALATAGLGLLALAWRLLS